MDIMDISWKNTPKISKLPQETNNFGDTPHPFSELSMMKWEVFGVGFPDFWGWLPGFLGLASRIFGVGFLDFWGWLPGFLGLASRIFVKSFPRFLDGAL